MKFFASTLIILPFAIALPAFATVLVNIHYNGQAVGSNVQFPS